MVNHSQGGINAGMITNTNVSYTKPTANQVLKYDATLDQWVPGTDASSTDATQLQGVDICTTTPTDGQVLTYDLATTEWCPSDPAGGGKIVQVVTQTNNFVQSFPNFWACLGNWVTITPTKATNKIIVFSAVPTRGGPQYTQYSISYFRHTASQPWYSAPLGTDMFPGAWPGGVAMDSNWSGTNGILSSRVPLNFEDTTHATTSPIYYNLAVKVWSNSYPAQTVASNWTTIAMEVEV